MKITYTYYVYEMIIVKYLLSIQCKKKEITNKQPIYKRSIVNSQLKRNKNALQRHAAWTMHRLVPLDHSVDPSFE